jgi:hypothetical protein
MTSPRGANVTGEELVHGKVLEHVANFWPNSVVNEQLQEEGPIHESLPGFRIAVLEPRRSREPYIYATNGCFVAESKEHVKHEFFMISPRRDDSHIQTLTMLATFHADERYRLDVGKVVAIGDPWMDQSTCDHLLVSLPYPYGGDGPRLEWLRLGDICIRFLWLMPITPREAAYAELNGPEALEEKFDNAKPDYLDPKRLSVV